MARPIGQYKEQVDKLYREIEQMSAREPCKATNVYLSKRLQVTTKQITRYLKTLKETGKIRVDTSSLRTDQRTGKLFKQRTISPLKPNSSMLVLPQESIQNDLTARKITPNKIDALKQLDIAIKRLETLQVQEAAIYQAGLDVVIDESEIVPTLYPFSTGA